MLKMLLLILLMGGCHSDAPPLLRIGSNIWPGYEILYLARDKGMLPPTVRLVELTSATQVMSALVNGDLEAAALTLDEALTVMARGVGLKVVLAFDFSTGADVLMARKEIGHLTDLKGKRIGVEKTAVGAVLLDGALQAVSLLPKDVEVVHVPINEHLAAYESGKVDAVVTFEPVRSQLLSVDARILFDSRNIPNRIVDVLVIRESAIHQHKDHLRQVLAAYFQALDSFHRDPKYSMELMAPRLNLPSEKVEVAFSGLRLLGLKENLRLLKGDKPVLKKTMASLYQLMKRQGLLDNELAFSYVLDGRWLPPGSVDQKMVSRP